jgi:hypothetical protein
MYLFTLLSSIITNNSKYHQNTAVNREGNNKSKNKNAGSTVISQVNKEKLKVKIIKI